MRTSEQIYKMALRLSEGQTLTREETGGYELAIIGWLQTIADNHEKEAEKIRQKAGNCDKVIGQLRKQVK
jgi:hypothetical protein